jgi:hypothetical protein
MLRILPTIFAAAAFMLIANGAQAQDTALTCEDARCLFQQQVDAECSCSEAANHGRYVKCVGKIIRQLTSEHPEFKNCRGKLVRCAARSTCGKEGFVTCTKVKLGTCDTIGGYCMDEGLTDVPCISDDQCVLSSRCSTKRSAEICEARGGIVGDSATCCSNCVVTP